MLFAAEQGIAHFGRRQSAATNALLCVEARREISEEAFTLAFCTGDWKQMTSVLHPLAKAAAEAMASMAIEPMERAGLFAARELMSGAHLTMAPPQRRASVVERLVPGASGSVPLRIYTPEHVVHPAPVCVYLHGGGWCLGNNAYYDILCHDYSYLTGSIVVYVEYRLAPENKFPAAPNDCFLALQWCHDHALEIGGDPARLWVMGDSAGGNLAAAVSLRARDGGGPPLALQVLICPALDPDAMGRTASSLRNSEGFGLTRANMDWLWDHYARTKDDWSDPYFAPLQAQSLAGLPPALIITAGFDPLRDEAHQYGERLATEGVTTTVVEFPDMPHCFMQNSHALERHKEFRDAISRKTGEILVVNI